MTTAAAVIVLGVMALLALTLLYAGVRFALSRPAQDSSEDGEPGPSASKPREMATRAVMTVAALTTALSVLAIASHVTIGHISVLIVFLTLTAVTSGLRFTGTYLPAGPARISARAILVLALLAWLAWPGWLTTTLVAAVITVCAIPLFEFGWSFYSLAVAGLTVAFGYDAVQVWATRNITSMVTPSVHGGQWLPLMYYAPASLDLHAPVAYVLGVGDVMIPAVLVLAAGRVAQQAGKPSILRAALGAWLAGLVAVDVILLTVSGAAFPVTVFTIPAIVAAVVVAASNAGVRPMLATVPRRESAA